MAMCYPFLLLLPLSSLSSHAIPSLVLLLGITVLPLLLLGCQHLPLPPPSVDCSYSTLSSDARKEGERKRHSTNHKYYPSCESQKITAAVLYKVLCGDMMIQDIAIIIVCHTLTSVSIDEQTCPSEEQNFGKSPAIPLMFY